MSDFVTAWKTAKEAYELATDEKKPSQTFLGIRKGTGISKALATLDAGLKDLSLKGAAAAYKSFLLGGIELTKLLEARVKEVDKADAAKKAALVKASKMLVSVLNEIRDEIPEAVAAALKQKEAAAKKDIPTNVEELYKKKNYWKDFEEYCKKERNEENILFFLAYKAGIHKKTPQKIIDSYVAKNAKHEINISAAARKKIVDGNGALVASPDFVPMYNACLANLADPYARWHTDYIGRSKEAFRSALKGIPLP